MCEKAQEILILSQSQQCGFLVHYTETEGVVLLMNKIREMNFKTNGISTEVKAQRELFPEYQYVTFFLDLKIC